jgi:phospholipid/cholesterol/gamma-HCH transport system substrate-binding protein
MNNKVNYALVGFLVLVGISLILGVSYWMLKPSVDSQETKYSIYFDESVLGLNIDAPVKYRGINVGKVTKLRISPKNSEKIEVVITILKTTPVKVDTVAKLTAQGITGLTYINLSRGGHMSAILTKHDGEEYPVIKTIPSFFKNFEKSLGSVSNQLSSTLGRTEELLGDDNQRAVTELLLRSASLMQKVDKLMDDKTIQHLQATIKNVDSFTYKLDAVMPNIDAFIDKSVLWEKSVDDSLSSISTSYLTISSSMDEFEKSIKNGDYNLKEISSDVVPTMNNTFLQMQELMINVESVLHQYTESPSDILYRKSAIRKDPGEE